MPDFQHGVAPNNSFPLARLDGLFFFYFFFISFFIEWILSNRHARFSHAKYCTLQLNIVFLKIFSRTKNFSVSSLPHQPTHFLEKIDFFCPTYLLLLFQLVALFLVVAIVDVYSQTTDSYMYVHDSLLQLTTGDTYLCTIKVYPEMCTLLFTGWWVANEFLAMATILKSKKKFWTDLPTLSSSTLATKNRTFFGAAQAKYRKTP